jgi:hypothetical protein
MNTCGSISKQSTLSIFRMNTYAKTQGVGCPSHGAPRTYNYVRTNRHSDGDIQTFRQPGDLQTFQPSDFQTVRTLRPADDASTRERHVIEPAVAAQRVRAVCGPQVAGGDGKGHRSLGRGIG